jgi:pimeloyl-ACP methyl ester carboxylesterase
METVSHDGRETAYRLVGSGPARILYVHGSGATHRVWAAQYGPDGPARPATALDLSGHGDSDDVDTAPGPATLDAYARDVTAVAEAAGADVLVGTSLGGAVCLHVALETPFDPAGLVLAGTGAKLAVHEDLRAWLADDFERAVEFLHGPDRLFHNADKRVVERSTDELRETGQAVTRRDFLTCHRFDVRDRLAEIGTPALAVVGEHDRLTPPAYHEHLADNMPACEYVEVGSAAHLAMAERPDAFNRPVERFLDSVEKCG